MEKLTSKDLKILKLAIEILNNSNVTYSCNAIQLATDIKALGISINTSVFSTSMFVDVYRVNYDNDKFNSDKRNTMATTFKGLGDLYNSIIGPVDGALHSKNCKHLLTDEMTIAELRNKLIYDYAKAGIR